MTQLVVKYVQINMNASLALTLFVPWVRFAINVDPAFPTHNVAVRAVFLDSGTNLHGAHLRKIWHRQWSDGSRPSNTSHRATQRAHSKLCVAK